MARLLLIRHGETEANSSERYWGNTDVKLSDIGIKQAERLHHRLANEKIGTIYSSDLSRALTTARIITDGRDISITVCPELREINFGNLEGLTFAEISQKYPEFARQWSQHSPNLQYPGGESAEEFNSRVIQFAERLKIYGEDDTVLIVAHSGILRTMICHLLGIDLWRRWQFVLNFASLSEVFTTPGRAFITLLNDTSHLDGLKS